MKNIAGFNDWIIYCSDCNLLLIPLAFAANIVKLFLTLNLFLCPRLVFTFLPTLSLLASGCWLKKERIGHMFAGPERQD